jgi:cytochrome P450
MIYPSVSSKAARSVAAAAPSRLGFRTLSTVNAPSSAETSGKSSTDGTGCPVSPILNKVPSLPFVGSMIPQHSGVPRFDLRKQYEFNNMIRRKFGNFIEMGFPGFGIGLNGIMYNIYDPNEMTKVVRSEGDRPSGIVEKLWAWRRAMKDSGSALVSKKDIGEDGEEYDYGLFDKGDVWKRHRTFLQTGMLDPKAARGFIPGIIEAAATASEVAPNHGEKVNDYLNYTAFDMFCSFMFGTQMRTTSTVVSTDPTVKAANAENERFVTAALGVFETTNQMNMFPHHYLIAKYLPFYKTSMYKELEKDWTTVREIGLKKIHDFIDRYDRNELDDMEKKSYLAGAIERQRQTKEVSQDEMAELCLIALFVGVDTTSSVTAWNLMHLALNPDVQQKLNDELTASLKEKGSEGTKLNADVLGKKVSPYLHMCIRESHRITPAFGAAMWKTNSKKELDIHGVTMPKGCMFQMGHISYDSEYVDEPQTFKPERWTAEGTETRKGTKSEVLDHPYLRDPFSQGARRCPGSRVATNEIFAMIAQLVLDWKISVPDENIKSLDDVTYDASPIKPIFPTLQFEAR